MELCKKYRAAVYRRLREGFRAYHARKTRDGRRQNERTLLDSFSKRFCITIFSVHDVILGDKVLVEAVVRLEQNVRRKNMIQEKVLEQYFGRAALLRRRKE